MEELNNLINVYTSDGQLTNEQNRIWIQQNGESVEVPTYEEFSDLKSALNTATESIVFTPIYRVGYVGSDGSYNPYSSGKSYAIDISDAFGTLYADLIDNNYCAYALYTQTIDNVTSDTAPGKFEVIYSSGVWGKHIELTEKQYSAYKTMIVSVGYNASNMPTVMVYCTAKTKAELSVKITNDLAQNLIPALNMVAGNINSGTGADDSSSSRLRSSNFLPPFSGVLSTTNVLGGFYLYAWEGNTFKGGWTGSAWGSSVRIATLDIYDIAQKYPTYMFKIVYLLSSGSATIANISELKLTSVLYPDTVMPSEKIRMMYNNIGGFAMGIKENDEYQKLSTANALAKIANYKQFYAQYQPNVLALEEYPESDTTGDNKNYIDTGNTIDPDIYLYPYIYPHTTTVNHNATIKTDYRIVEQKNIAESGTYYYSTRGKMAVVETPNGRKIAIISTVFDTGVGHYPSDQASRKANRAEQMAKCISLLSDYDLAIIGADTNIEDQNEYNSMVSTFQNAGYQVANGGFYPLTDTCPGDDYKPIDNIFVKGDAKLKSFVVPNVLSELASDHLPVITDILLY